MVHNHSIVGPMVHNHRKPSLPMVVLPENHRKVDCNFENHWMFVMVAKECAKSPTNTRTNFKSKKILSFRVYLHLNFISSSWSSVVKKFKRAPVDHCWKFFYVVRLWARQKRTKSQIKIRAFVSFFQGQNHRWPSHLNLGKPSKNHWCQWLIWKKHSMVMVQVW